MFEVSVTDNLDDNHPYKICVWQCVFANWWSKLFDGYAWEMEGSLFAADTKEFDPVPNFGMFWQKGGIVS